MVGDAQALELESDSVDVLVSGLMLNFVPKPEVALAEMQRIVKPDGQYWHLPVGLCRGYADAALTSGMQLWS